MLSKLLYFQIPILKQLTAQVKLSPQNRESKGKNTKSVFAVYSDGDNIASSHGSV